MINDKPNQEESCLAPLADPAVWTGFVDLFADKNRHRQRKTQAFRDLLPQSAELAEAVLTASYQPELPRRLAVSKMDSRRKRLVYVYPPADELVFKLCGRLLGAHDHLLPAACHAFRPRHGARQAFQSLLRQPDLDRLAVIRVDIADYFNSIPPEGALAALPVAIRADVPLMNVLRQVVLAGGYCAGGQIVSAAPAGIKPGTPLAPILANYYLAGLDRHFLDQGILYARYSDDIILFVPPERQTTVFAELCKCLEELGLALNEAKTCLRAPGERWEYLGFAYERGRIDLSGAALHKIKARVRRLARRLNRYRCRKNVPPDKILHFFFRRLNGRLYGYDGQPTRFCWTRWYLPVINTAGSLGELDRYCQEAARYACTGHYRRVNYRLFTRTQLTQAGCRPLVPFYFARGWRKLAVAGKPDHPDRNTGRINSIGAVPAEPADNC